MTAIQAIAAQGRLSWRKRRGYNPRAFVEGQSGCFKQTIEPMLRFYTIEAQATEIAIAAEGLNRILNPGRPNSACVA